MGFYGSVYYQLINTFHKFIAENDGALNNSSNFLASTPTNDIVLEANGRKSVIDLDTGNRWLSFSQNGDKVMLWHNKADSTAANLETSIAFTGTASNKKGGNSSTNATQLGYGDVFSTDILQYDKAGHISKKQTKYFKLPEEVINFKVDAIEALLLTTLGTEANITSKIAEIKSKFPTGVNNIFEYVQYNDSNNKKYHEAYIGNWENICDYWSSRGKPTITAVIGDLDDLFNGSDVQDYGSGKTYHPSLVSCIGNMSQIAKDFKDSEKAQCSISEALHMAKETIDANYEYWETQNSENEQAISNLQSQQDTLNNGLVDFRTLTNNKIGLLEAADQAEKEARETADATLTTNLNKEISDRESAVSTLTTNLNKEIGDRETAVTAIHTILGNKGDTNDSVYVEIGKLHAKDGLIDEDIKKINDIIGDSEGLGTVYSEIRALNKGYQDGDKEVIKKYEDADQAIIDTYIGTKLDGSYPLYTEISNIKNDITTKTNAINDRLGDSITTSNTVETQISTLKTYTDTTFETLENAKLYAKKTDVEGEFAKYTTTETLSANYLTKQSATDTYLTKENAGQTYMMQETANKTFATNESLEGVKKESLAAAAEVKTLLSAEIDNINNNIGRVEGEGQITANQLSELLNKIERIETAIINLGGTLEETPQE